MNLPNPPASYDTQDQGLTRRRLQEADQRNHKRNQDIEVGAARVILTSPNGARWALTVSNAGALSATAL